MYPLHADHPDSAPNWANYSNVDLNVGTGDGRYSWVSTASSSNRVLRGVSGVAGSNDTTPSTATGSYGWRPVLEFFA